MATSDVLPLLTVSVLTLFPDMFPGPLGHSLSGAALERGIWDFKAIDIRSFAKDRHKTVDDTPFGGGPGMVMRADVLDAAVSETYKGRGRLIYFSPRGKPFDQELSKELSRESSLTFLCGRYEGIDERVLEAHPFEEISLGDFVLSGGELAALSVLDSVIRLLPGVMGKMESMEEESFSQGLLEYPQYTRPQEWNGKAVPEILVSGHHENIRKWRLDQAKEITKKRRPDLWEAYSTQQ